MILPTKGHLATSGDIFGFHSWEEGCYWHLVSRGRGCCLTSGNTQATLCPHNKALACPNVNGATAEKLSQMNKTGHNIMNLDLPQVLRGKITGHHLVITL